MSILCSLKNMSLSFGQKIIFDQTELTIHKGDKIGLIGLNGQGKSTLFNILAEKQFPDTTTPSFIFDKSNTDFDIFLIPQELNIKSNSHLTPDNYYLSFYPELSKIHFRLEVIQELLCNEGDHDKILLEQEGLFTEYDRLQGWDIQSNYESYLKHFDVDTTGKSLTDLSGGERRKMALSIGLSTPFKFVLWDEPTNHLDIETIEKFEDELESLNSTYMIISHDRYLLNNVTNKIVHIERGGINSFKGTYLDYMEYLAARELELQKNLDKLENRHRRELAWMRQGTKARRTRSKKRVEGYNQINTDIATLKSRSRRVVDLNMFHSGRKTKQLVKVTDGDFGYNENLLLKQLNLMISKKDKIALIGPNGAGKTTLLNILRGHLKLISGEFQQATDLKVITFDQHREALPLDKTPFEVVGEGVDFVILGNGQRKHIHAYLESFLFTADQVNRPIETLSGGEKNRLQLAMFMKQSADLWIFDEPTNDLDIETIELLEAELKSYESAVIIVGHDRAFLDNICNITWLVHNKEVELFEGGYSQVAPYLHALELEKKLAEKQRTDPKKVEAPQEEKKPKKQSQKEIKALEKIEKEIESHETVIEDLKSKMGGFDFSDMTTDKQSEYDQLTKELESSEKELTIAMTKWEELSS